MIFRLFAKKNRKLLIWATIFVSVLIGYLIKSLLGIDFFDSMSLSSHFPFKFIASSSIITDPKPGVLLHEDFEKWRIKRIWGILWMEEKGKVTKKISKEGIGNSRCLLISSNSNKAWSYSNRKFIEVRNGDIFRIDGFVKIDGEKAIASIGVSAFDENQKSINWDYVRAKTNKTGMWIEIKKRLHISEKIKYIKLNLSGYGTARFYFDNIYFRKL